MQLRSGNTLKYSLSMNTIPTQRLHAKAKPCSSTFTKTTKTKTNTKSQNTHIYFTNYSEEETEEDNTTMDDNNMSEYEYESQTDSENDSDYDSYDEKELQSNFKIKTQSKAFDNNHPKYEEWLVTELLVRVHIANKQTNILDKLRAISELTYILNEELEYISKIPHYENFVTIVIFNKYKEMIETIPQDVLNELSPSEIKEHSIFIFDVQNELVKLNNRIQVIYNKLL